MLLLDSLSFLKVADTIALLTNRYVHNQESFHNNFNYTQIVLVTFMNFEGVAMTKSK